MISYAFAQALTPAAAPTDWTGIIVIAVIGIIIGGVIWYVHTHPTAAATISADWSALVARVSALEGKVATAVTPAPVPAAPAAPAGKNGVAGTFSLTVTGNPATDLPAINAHYFS